MPISSIAWEPRTGPPCRWLDGYSGQPIFLFFPGLTLLVHHGDKEWVWLG